MGLGESEFDRGSVPNSAFDGRAAPVEPHDGLDNGEAQPRPARCSRPGDVRPVESIKDFRKMFGRDAAAGIVNRDFHGMIVA